MSDMPPNPPARRPVWREPMMWLVVGGPMIVVVASLATMVLAIRGADPIVTSPTFAPTPSPDASRQPAVQARNHAATPR